MDQTREDRRAAREARAKASKERLQAHRERNARAAAEETAWLSLTTKQRRERRREQAAGKMRTGAPENKALQPQTENKQADTTQPEPDATDAARKLAQEHKLDLAAMKGTGSGGRITVGDVQAALDAQG
jgi:pyruvate/2-oxoglutarate dehydrogenase complex dihydrolipoamide acyltransferase (E2) component